MYAQPKEAHRNRVRHRKDQLSKCPAGLYLSSARVAFFDGQRYCAVSLCGLRSTYRNTCREDYDNLTPEEKSIFYSCHFIGPEDIQDITNRLVASGLVSQKDAGYCFGTGYAVQRNIILYEALGQKVDYLLFLDDDEYPLAVTRTQNTCLWSGQFVWRSILNIFSSPILLWATTAATSLRCLHWNTTTS